MKKKIEKRRLIVDGDVRAVWDFHARKLRQINFGERFNEWSEAQVAAFRNPKTESDLNELCAHGCQEEVLFVFLYVVRHAPKLAALWAAMVGPPKKRGKTSRVLERAAASLNDALAIVLAAEDEEARRQLSEMDRIPPSLLIAELKLYASYFKLAESLKIETETRSPTELARFLLTYYVVRATGRPHDRNIATLLTEAQNLETYDEIAQRMWRDRNYKRLMKHHSKIGDLIFAFSVVMSRQT